MARILTNAPIKTFIMESSSPPELRHVPEELTIAVPQAHLLLMREALHYGLENTRGLLSIHDAHFGREHRHNYVAAEALEHDIDKMNAAYTLLDPLCHP